MVTYNTLQLLTTYIENLCAQHVDIRHSTERCHFVRLCADEQMTKSKTLYPPIVSMEKVVSKYTGPEESLNKSRSIDLMFLDNVKDTHDFNLINEVWEHMESIADDFMIKINQDKQDRVNYPFLRNVNLSGSTLDYVESVGTMWGVIVSINISAPAIDCNNAQDYLTSKFTTV